MTLKGSYMRYTKIIDDGSILAAMHYANYQAEFTIQCLELPRDDLTRKAELETLLERIDTVRDRILEELS